MNLRRPRTTRHRFGFAPWGHRRWWHRFESEWLLSEPAIGAVAGLIVLALAIRGLV